MSRLNALAALTVLTLATPASAATLNKCIDAQGNVTYSNLPCRNEQKARTVEIDPAPLPDPVRSRPADGRPVPLQPPPMGPARAGSKPPPISSSEPATIQMETRRTGGTPASRAAPRQCDRLTEKLGNVIDKMDQARRKGYTQQQMDKWNQEVKDLERQKQQSGCF